MTVKITAVLMIIVSSFAASNRDQDAVTEKANKSIVTAAIGEKSDSIKKKTDPGIAALATMHGDWKKKWSNNAKPEFETVSEKQFWENMEAGKIQIRGNQINARECYIQSSATIAVDFSGHSFKSFAERKPTNGSLMMLTLDNGTPILTSYNQTGDTFTLRYPAGCCTRSGLVIEFSREMPEGQPDSKGHNR